MKSEILQAKFNSIYESESDKIFRFCLVRVSDREQAMDLSQEVFVRFWQALISDKDITNPRGFLFTIARNLIIDWYRKKKTVSLEGLTAEGEEVHEPGDGISDIEREMGVEGRYVMEKINELDISHRDAVYLRFVEGLPPREVSEILGISVNATSVRINRGIEKLRKLTGYDIDEEKYGE